MSVQLDGAQSPSINGLQIPKKVKKRKLVESDREAASKKRKPSPSGAGSIAASTEPPIAVIKEKKKSRVDALSSENRRDHVASRTPSIHMPDAPSTAGSEERLQNGIGHTAEADGESTKEEDAQSDLPSPFHSVRLSLYVSLPGISIHTATASLLSTHLAPLLLTYYAPATGIVLGFSDPVISAKPALSNNLPLAPPSHHQPAQSETFALAADEYGASWVWLTVTLLVFRPEKGMEMEGHVNICSEGFIGLVCYNYFQTAIAKNRIPLTWRWNGPGGDQTSSRRRRGKKGKIKDSQIQIQEADVMSMDVDDTIPGRVEQEEAADDGLGFFVDTSGKQIRDSVRFKVVDSEVVPSHGREKWSLQIDGTLLNEQDEAKVMEEERLKFDQIQNRGWSRTPKSVNLRHDGDALMSGGIGLVREESNASQTSVPAPALRHRVAY